MDEMVRTFKDTHHEQIELRFSLQGPFLYLAAFYPEYDGTWFGEKGLIRREVIFPALELLRRREPVEIPVANHTIVRRGSDGSVTYHRPYQCNSLTIQGDNEELRLWMIDMLLTYRFLAV